MIARLLEINHTTMKTCNGGSEPILSGSNEELVRWYHHTGDHRAFAELYRRFSTLVLGSCIKTLKDPIAAKDAASDIFLHLHKKLRAARPLAFRAWLYSVTKNHCLQVLRSEARQPRMESMSELLESAEPRTTEPEPDNAPRYINRVRAAIAKLPERQMTCIGMFFLQNLRYKEISEETGWSLKEVKSHIQNGKRNLRKSLGEVWKEAGFAG